MEIIPAVMPNTLKELEEYASKIRGLVQTIQIDVMDGVFVPPENWPYSEKASFDEILHGDRTLPFCDEIKYEIDLMIKNPEYEIGKWLKAGVSRVVIHIESTKNMAQVLESVNSRADIGIALNTTTPNEVVYSFLDRIQFIQCMGIARIGYQGEPFDERVIPKIKDFKEKYPHVIIQVDGAVNQETAPKLVEAGATRLVAGSAIWKSDDITKTINEFNRL